MVLRFVLPLALAALAALAPTLAIADGEVVVRFREPARCAHDLVRLGDLIEVIGGQSPAFERLTSMPLGPAPRSGEAQSWHRDDVLRHLQLRGVHPAGIRWNGATQAKLERLPDSHSMTATTMTPAFLSERTIQQAENLVSQAIAEYLALQTGDRVAWRIAVHIPNQYAETMQVRRNIVGVGGGSEPWLGDQQFMIQLKLRDGPVNIPIKANVELPPMVVVAKRPIRRDQVLSAEMLTYKSLTFNAKEDGEYFTDMAGLIGQQMRRSISSGLPLTQEVVGDPIVVSSAELVTVESVSGGIVVTSHARSLGSGAVGDLIEVELPGRNRLLATVVGPMTVRVAAASSRSTAR